MRFFAVLLLLLPALASCSKKPLYPEAPVSGETVTIDIKAMKEASPVFYSFRHGDKRIDFFVVKLNGEIQSYFDACAKCYTDRVGYRAAGGSVLCRKCSIKYSIESLKTGIGSCYPVALKGKTEGEDKYIIEKKAVIEGEKFFKSK